MPSSLSCLPGRLGVLNRFLDGVLYGLLDDLLHRVLDILVAEDVFADLGHRDSHRLLDADGERVQFLREDRDRLVGLGGRQREEPAGADVVGIAAFGPAAVEFR